jgi:branched-chain amino acid transport system ATP-binding protein
VVLVEQNAHVAFAVARRGYLLARGTVAVAGSTDRLRAHPKVRAAYLDGTG